MSEQREPTGVPRVELRHRLGLALEYAKLSNEAMADHLGKSVTTIRNYLSGRTHPDRSTCRD
jgi:ribosome-binding protein aMBF1 (putative translation factor)